MSARAASDALHARVRAMVRAFERGQEMPEPFDALAVDLARFQAVHVPGYGRLCAAHGLDPALPSSAAQAPAVPTEAFKLGDVFAFDAKDAAACFRTSGTTGAARGVHRMRTVETYDVSAIAFARATLAHDLVLPLSVLVLGPSTSEAADSSLMHMCAALARAWSVPEPTDWTFFVHHGKLEVERLRDRIEELPPGRPAVVLATSFALVHLLDEIGHDVLALPRDSRVMLTGGFKGKSRVVPASELYGAVAHAFGVDAGAVVGEYGMTELSSQFWEAALVRGERGKGVYVEPPWARVVPVDPETLKPVPEGEVGIARVEDLANVDSAFAVLTEDRVRRVAGGGFELLGRCATAPPRGCSIAFEEMLVADAGS
jgi:acyl-CoA synthetase (AMP-forming)/AMP-acid ligase II